MYKLSRKIIGYLLFILVTVSNIYGIDKFEPFYVDNNVNNLVFTEELSTWGDTVDLSGMAVGPNSTMFVILTYRNNFSLVKQIDINGNILRTWGEKGTGVGEFMVLSDIVVDSSRGVVYVTDTSNHRVQKFHFNGNFITEWGTYGSLNGQFKRPTKLALDTYGNVYVADYDNNRIQKFNQNGTFILKFGGAGSGDGRFDRPSDIAIDQHNYIYVADYMNGRIQKFNSSGGLIQKISISRPRAVIVDKRGYIYIAADHKTSRYDANGNFLNYLVNHDYGITGTHPGARGYHLNIDSMNNIFILGSNRIDKFNGSTQMPMRAWGKYGSDRGEFPYARAMVFDQHGNFFVADTYNGRIQKFDKNGHFLKQWGKYGEGAGEFYYISDIAVDSFGNVYVVDSGNHRIQKFNNNGNYIRQWGISSNAALGIAINKDNDIYVSSQSGIHIFTVDGISVDNWATPTHAEIAISPIDNSVYLGTYSRVDKYTESGTLITSWGQNGSGAGEFSFLSSLTVTNNGDVYTYDNDRIQKFNSNGDYIREYKKTPTGYTNEFNGGLSTDAYGVVYAFTRTYNTDNYPYEVTQIDRLGIRANVDIDGDGVDNNEDAFPRNPREWLDTDHDGIGNNADTDDDNDGISDSLERANGLNPLNASDAQADFDNDGFSNATEVAVGTSVRNSQSKPIWTPINMGDLMMFIPAKP